MSNKEVARFERQVMHILETELKNATLNEQVELFCDVAGFEAVEQYYAFEAYEAIDAEDSKYTYLDEESVRDSFWKAYPDFTEVPGQRQNKYNATIRTAFCDYVDYLQRDGAISDELCNDVTL